MLKIAGYVVHIHNYYKYLICEASFLASQARSLASANGASLASCQRMIPSRLLAIRHLEARGRRIPVLLSRNERGSVAGRVILADDDAPILDGPDIDSVLKLIKDQLEWLLAARSRENA